jgi:translation initiation factor IF-2
MKRKGRHGGGGGGGGGSRSSGKPAAHAGGGYYGYGQKKAEPTRPSEPSFAPGAGAGGGGKSGYGGGSQQSGSYFTQQQRSEADGQQRAYQRHQVTFYNLIGPFITSEVQQNEVSLVNFRNYSSTNAVPSECF